MQFLRTTVASGVLRSKIPVYTFQGYLNGFWGEGCEIKEIKGRRLFFFFSPLSSSLDIMAIAKQSISRFGFKCFFFATFLLVCDGHSGKRENGGPACYGGFDLYFILDK